MKIEPMVPFTRADSLSTSTPSDPVRSIRAITETHGAFVEVTDDEIYAAIPTMGYTSGVFAEPGAASAWAGLEKAAREGLISDGENVVVVCTGSGMNDISGVLSSMENVNLPTKIGCAADVE